jgi:adenine-specific DNA methylase
VGGARAGVAAGATLLDAGLLPVEPLATLGWREARRPRPIYGAHRWFARRLGTSFRALLVAAVLPADVDFFASYYAGADLSGMTVLDPFVGGGTSVVEAQRLGAATVGVDVDPVACAITAFEARAHQLPALDQALAELAREVGAALAPYYRTITPDGQPRDVLHYFWVQVVTCPGCGLQVECHPHYQLAHDTASDRQWVLCASCHAVGELPCSAATLACGACGTRTELAAGPGRGGRLRCPDCRHQEPLISLARRSGAPPAWRLVATETIAPPAGRRPVPIAERRFQAASRVDLELLAKAQTALAARTGADGRIAFVPDRAIPSEGRADDRLLAYGYRCYRELFNPRQLLHLSTLAEVIAARDGAIREALALAFSDHLATNCMLTSYAFGWRRLVPLFAVRAFRHVSRPVELNPWSDGTGRGSFPNAVRQVARSAAFARAPQEPQRGGGFRATGEQPTDRAAARIVHGSAERLELDDDSVDLILTDPPYFDNVCYSELADFYLPWLELLGLVRADAGPEPRTASLAAPGRGLAAADRYRDGLTRCFAEMTRVLRPGGRLVFTFQHRTQRAWVALSEALRGTPLRPLAVFPLLGDGGTGLHAHPGASTWDAVFVLDKPDPPVDRPAGPGRMAAAEEHAAGWAARLEAALPGRFRQPDRDNFTRACRLAAELGLFG